MLIFLEWLIRLLDLEFFWEQQYHASENRHINFKAMLILGLMDHKLDVLEKLYNKNPDLFIKSILEIKKILNCYVKDMQNKLNNLEASMHDPSLPIPSLNHPFPNTVFDYNNIMQAIESCLEFSNQPFKHPLALNPY